MPRFNAAMVLDHRLDNQIVKKEDLRFSEQNTAEDYATSEFDIDRIPRSVIQKLDGLFMVLEAPNERKEGFIPPPSEVFYISSNQAEG